MASLTKFTLGPSGELVYKKTGRLAPSNYTFRKNTVYKTGPDGVKRRVGSLSRKLTKGEAQKIAKAEANRKRRQAAVNKQSKQGKPSQQKPRKPSAKKAGAASMRYGEDWEEFDDTEFPEQSQAVKEEFAQRVRDAAASVAPPALQAKIRALTTEALWQGYQEDAYIFELYFRYHSAYDAPHPSDVSVWLYQFVYRIQQYMGVKS